MALFTDMNKRNWVVKINLPALERVKERTGVRLNKLVEFGKDNAFELSDPIELLAILIAVLEIGEGDNMSIEDFKKAMDDGDVLEKAVDALMDATIDFLPRQQRSSKRLTVSRLRESKPAMYQAMEKAARSLTPATMVAGLNRTMGLSAPSGTSEESQGSTPEPTDSGT